MIDETLAERVKVLEVQMGLFSTKQEHIVDKLDELLGLRNKGVGAFWLASSLAGTGLLGAFLVFIDWLRSLGHGGG